MSDWSTEALLLREVYHRPRDACVLEVEDVVELDGALRVNRRLPLDKGDATRVVTTRPSRAEQTKQSKRKTKQIIGSRTSRSTTTFAVICSTHGCLKRCLCQTRAVASPYRKSCEIGACQVARSKSDTDEIQSINKHVTCGKKRWCGQSASFIAANSTSTFDLEGRFQDGVHAQPVFFGP